MIRVSVLTASFNQGRFLAEALDSVAAQDYPVEHVVVDGGSDDETAAVIERRRERLAHVVVEPDDGPADGLNKALALATGDVVAVLNADDAFLPGAVASAARVFEDDPLLDVAYGHGYMVDAEGRVLRRLRSTVFDPRRFVLGGVTVVHQATFVRTEALLDVGGFNPRNRTSWDGEALVRLALAGRRMRRVHAYWALFRLHGSSISGSNRFAGEYEADQARLFELVMGRPPAAGDRLLAAGARVGKWARDPRGLAERLAESAGIRP